MGLRQMLANLFWPDDVEPEPEPEPEHRGRGAIAGIFWPEGTENGVAEAGAVSEAPSPTPAATPPATPAAGLGDRLKRVGISEQTRMQTGHHPGPVRHQAGEGRPEASLKRRLQSVGVPDMDAREHARQQRILDASRETESRARRDAAYEVAVNSIPVPIHAEAIPLPGGLRLHDDEFLAAGASRPTGERELTVTSQRLIYSKGQNAESQLVVYLADISDVAFHGSESITVGTASGRWERLPVAGNSVVASRDRFLALIHHARAQRTALPGGLDELVALRDAGAVGAEEYEARRAAAQAAPRRRRQRQVEVPGTPTRRTAAATRATAAPAPSETTTPPPAGGGTETGEV